MTQQCHVQVLDDSTDQKTRDLVDDKCMEWQERGVRCACVRRTNRKGYKAGALKDVSTQASTRCHPTLPICKQQRRSDLRAAIFIQMAAHVLLAEMPLGMCLSGSHEAQQGLHCGVKSLSLIGSI
jgi:hypothetical protein